MVMAYVPNERKEEKKMKKIMLLVVLVLVMLFTGCSYVSDTAPSSLSVVYRWGDGYRVELYADPRPMDVPIYTAYIQDGTCKFEDINPGDYEVRVYDDFELIDYRSVTIEPGTYNVINFGW
jgi:hypothetical protein